MGQACTAKKDGSIDNGQTQMQSTESIIVNGALDRAIVHGERCGEFVITEHEMPDAFVTEDRDALSKNIARLKLVRRIRLGDVPGLHDILDTFSSSKVIGMLPSLREIHLIGQSIDDRAAECAANLCRHPTGTSTSSVDIVVIANNKKNVVGDAGVLAFARDLSATNLTTLVLFGSHIGDLGSTGLAKQINTKTTLQRLVLYGKEIGNSTLEAFSIALAAAPLQEFVLGGTEFTDGPELANLLNSIWTTRKCERLGILNFHLGDSAAQKIVDLITSSNYCPEDLLLLAGQATEKAYASLSPLWTGPQNLQRLTLCSFVADDKALDAFAIRKCDGSESLNSALELVCGRASTSRMSQTLLRFEGLGYSIAPSAPPPIAVIPSSGDPTAAAPGIFLSNDPTKFLESHIFARVLLRAYRRSPKTGETRSHSVHSRRVSL
eukprot:GEMP01005071.1.p1 GENE.GEMP01005071.1~~GEMP01005071.1.p1  ORF type:complete len:436 (+),score=76.30 GEMP01005071.1:95-1402(+)